MPAASAGATASAGQGPAPDTADGLGLPIQAYLMTASESGELQKAQGILITKCMKSFGFTYIQQYATANGATDFDAANMSRRYGITNLVQASQYGYHLPQSTSTSSSTQQPLLSGAEYDVLWGHTQNSDSDTVHTTAGGVEIPNGGCMAESVRQAQHLAPAAPQAQLAQQVNLDSFSKSQSDPRVIAAIGAWAKCMDAAGYELASPLAAMSQFTGPLPASQAEITEAKTDLSCKSSTKLIQTWDAAETEIENQMIAANQEVFAQILQSKHAALKAAAQLLGQ